MTNALASPPAQPPAKNPIWPDPPRPASPRLLLRAVSAGLVGAALLPFSPGLNVLLTALVLVAVLAPVAPRSRTSALFAVLTVALLALPLLRDADWLVALAILLAVPLGSYALLGGRTWAELIGGGLMLSLALPRMLPWAGHGVAQTARTRRGPVWPMAGSLLIAFGLLVVFGALFAQADAAFNAILGDLAPEISARTLTLHVLTFPMVVGLVLAGSYLAAAPPRLRDLVPAVARPAGRTSWIIPIAALDLLFLCFVAVQANVFLADDKDRLLESTGLTYAQYARQGFWQLLLVTGLVLAVIAVAVRYAPLGGGGDRTLVRALLGLLCALTLVVVAVALRRLYLYEEVYGYTRLRVWVHAFELWLGVVIALIMVAGLRWSAAWLPRTVAATGAGGLLALGLLNPDGFIADRNVDRYVERIELTTPADIFYLSGLSADAVPALDRLPEPQRSCALRRLAAELRRPDSWPSANLARNRARALLAERPADPRPTC